MNDMEVWRPTQPQDSWVPMLQAVGDLSAKLAATQFVPRSLQRQPAAVAAAILTGREMGLGPMASLRGIDVIEGRPALTAQMLAARILAAGHRIEWVTATDKTCTVRIERGDGLSTAEATWTLADAQRAGLAGKKVWQQYPRHMLRARALSEAAAMACPDVALGLDVLDQASEGQERPSEGVTAVALPKPQPAPPEPQTPPRPEPLLSDDNSETVPPPDEPDPEPDPATAAQMRALNAAIGDVERASGGDRLTRDARRDLIRQVLGLDALGSAKELTRGQASDAIDRLRALAASAPTKEVL